MRRLFVFLLLWSAPAWCLPATEFVPSGDLIGQTLQHTLRKEDTLYDLARRYKVEMVALQAANPGVDPWVPGEGKVLTIPAQHILPLRPENRKGIVINLPELRLYYFARDRVYTYPIGIGREGWRTPTGTTQITRKRRNPSWTPPASIRAENPSLPASIPPGPNNPLGAYAMNLGWSSYTIHGTNKPDGIGRRSSHGCIRMYPEDIQELFPLVSKGTRVAVIDRPYSLGWQDGTLYLEVTPTQRQGDEILESGKLTPQEMPQIQEAIYETIAGHNVVVDWQAVRLAEQSRSSIPVPITMQIKPGAGLAPLPAPASPVAPIASQPVPQRTVPSSETQDQYELVPWPADMLPGEEMLPPLRPLPEELMP